MTTTTFPPITTTGSWSVQTTRGSTVTSSSVSRSKYLFTGSRVSTTTPNFRTLTEIGVHLKPLPYQFKRYERWMPTGFYREANREYLYGSPRDPNAYCFYGVGLYSPSIDRTSNYRSDVVVPSKLDGQVRNKVLDSMKNQKMNLPELVHTRSQTVGMVVGTAMNLVRAMGQLRRGNFAAAAGHLGVPAGRRGISRFNKAYARDAAKAVGGGWLALQYGWKPLLSDIYGAVDLVNQSFQRPQYQTVTKHGRDLTDLSQTFSSNSSGLIQTDVISGRKLTTVKYSVTYCRSPNPATTLAQMGITNPALLAWELLPYSFVVDWFLPIGNFLSNLDATVGLDFYCGYKTLASEVFVVQKTVFSGFYSPTSVYVQGQFFSEAKEINIERIVLTEFPSVALPSFKDPTSVVHLANAMGLLSQTYRK